VSWDDKVGWGEKGVNGSGEAVSGGKRTRRGGATDGEGSQGLGKGRRTPGNLFSRNTEIQACFFWNKLLTF